MAGHRNQADLLTALQVNDAHRFSELAGHIRPGVAPIRYDARRDGCNSDRMRHPERVELQHVQRRCVGAGYECVPTRCERDVTWRSPDGNALADGLDHMARHGYGCDARQVPYRSPNRGAWRGMLHAVDGIEREVAGR